MITFLATLVVSSLAFANDGESFSSYESIVSELKLDAEQVPAVPKQEPMDWDSIAIHASVGLAGSLVSVPNDRRGGLTTGLLKGFETALGVQTFSRQARAELAFRNYAGENIATGLRAEMREFEGRMIFLPVIQDDLRMRMGFGLTQRFLNVEEDGQPNARSGTYYSLLIGAEKSVAKSISVGPDVAYRDSINRVGGRKSSWDASFRLNATF